MGDSFKFDKEDVAAIAKLIANVEELQRVIDEQQKVIKVLTNWKDACTKTALVWASVCAAGMTMATFFFSNFEKIKYFLAGKQ